MNAKLLTLAGAASALALGAAGAANAMIVVNLPPPNPYIAALDPVHSTGSTADDFLVFGETLHNGDGVTFHSTQEVLDLNGSGVAQIDGPWSNLDFYLTDGGSFNAVNFAVSASGTNGAHGVDAYLDVLIDGVVTLNDYKLGNGENKFSVVGTENETFSNVGFRVYTSTANTTVRTVDSLRQVEVDVNPGVVVPEPAAWALMIMGFGGVGGMMRRRRTLAA